MLGHRAINVQNLHLGRVRLRWGVSFSSGCAPVCYIFGRLRSLESRRTVYSLHLAAKYVRFCPWPPRRPASRHLYQPSNCLIDDCPIARCDGGDSSGLVDELLPSFLAGIKNVGVGLEHAVGEIGLAQVLPDVLSRVEFRTCWRQ